MGIARHFTHFALTAPPLKMEAESVEGTDKQVSAEHLGGGGGRGTGVGGVGGAIAASFSYVWEAPGRDPGRRWEWEAGGGGKERLAVTQLLCERTGCSFNAVFFFPAFTSQHSPE